MMSRAASLFFASVVVVVFLLEDSDAFMSTTVFTGTSPTVMMARLPPPSLSLSSSSSSTSSSGLAFVVSRSSSSKTTLSMVTVSTGDEYLNTLSEVQMFDSGRRRAEQMLAEKKADEEALRAVEAEMWVEERATQLKGEKRRRAATLSNNAMMVASTNDYLNSLSGLQMSETGRQRAEQLLTAQKMDAESMREVEVELWVREQTVKIEEAQEEATLAAEATTVVLEEAKIEAARIEQEVAKLSQAVAEEALSLVDNAETIVVEEATPPHPVVKEDGAERGVKTKEGEEAKEIEDETDTVITAGKKDKDDAKVAEEEAIMDSKEKVPKVVVDYVGKNNKVSVSVRKLIPHVPPQEVFETWLDFTWKKGGGLPILCIENQEKRSRTLLPLFCVEKLLEGTTPEDGSGDDENGDSPTSSIIQEYVLTSVGPIWKSEIKENSHLGRVSFDAVVVNDENDDEGEPSLSTEMTWNVTFDTLHRRDLWQSVTESSISDACGNLAAYLARPLLLTSKVEIRTDVAADVLAEKWFDFVWRDGGGISRPLVLDKDGNDRMLIPPFLQERVLERKSPTPQQTDILYTVVNPSLFTFYPVYTHLGRVRFKSSASSSTGSLFFVEGTNDTATAEMIWEVSVRPIRNYESFVKTLTETVINTLSSNFKAHVEGDEGMIDEMFDPAGTVDVFLPRGLMRDRGALFEIPMESWLGGVLYSRFKDNCLVLGQTKDLMKPWRWGLTDEADSATSWSTGSISKNDNH